MQSPSSKIRLLVLSAIFVAPFSMSLAAEIKSITSPSILYDVPSERGRKVAIAPRGMPVEVVLNYGEWTKVRDVSGELNWVDAKALSAKRMVVVKGANTRVQAAPDEAAAGVFIAERGLLLELIESGNSASAPPTWLRVRHRDGLGGFVRAADIWGD